MDAPASGGLEELLDELVVERPALNLRERLRRRAGAVLVDNFFEVLARGSKRIPLANPRLHGLEVIRDVPYREGGLPEHRLDVWRPEQRPAPLPVVLYVHGGRFARLSKDTHWIFALVFARRGYVVFNISYRLAPKHRYPAAHEDACAAYEWVAENAHRYGGDPSRIIVAGESAGANLATSLAVASSYRRREAWARRVFDLKAPPSAVLPHSGIYQVSDPERFMRSGPLPSFVYDRLAEVCDEYLCGARVPADGPLCDPVVALERGEPPHRPLPPFFIGCGTWDPLLDDSRRLERALTRLGAPAVARYYERGPHAFHGFVFLPMARRYWREAFEFLSRHAPSPLGRR